MSPTYDIHPGKGVGPFLLGDSLWHILDQLRGEKTLYPKVELAWDSSKPHKSDLTITLPHLTLLFPHPSQRLSLLRFTGIPTSNLTLSYDNQVLTSPSFALTRAVVSRTLGPTYGGEGEKLVYPGITFELGKTGGRDDKVHNVIVGPKDDGEDMAILTPLMGVKILPNKGITLTTRDLGAVEVVIGETTSQDLMLDLGQPLRQNVKEDNRLERMWGSTSQNDLDGQSTFWNYFQYGLDFLISQEGVVQKVLAHSNIPGTPLFQRYARSPLSISTPSGDLDLTSPLSAFQAHFSPPQESSTRRNGTEPTPNATLAVPAVIDPTPPNPSSNTSKHNKKNKRGGSSNSSPPEDGPEQTRKVAGEAQVDGSKAQKKEEAGVIKEAMALDRVVEGGLDGVEGVGTSRLIGFDGLVVEQDEDSGAITSILVFRV